MTPPEKKKKRYKPYWDVPKIFKKIAQWPMESTFQYPEDDTTPCHYPKRKSGIDLAREILKEAGIVHGGNLPGRLYRAIGKVYGQEIESGNEVEIYKVGVIGLGWRPERNVFLSRMKVIRRFRPQYSLVFEVPYALKCKIKKLKAPINGLTCGGIATKILARKIRCLLYNRPLHDSLKLLSSYRPKTPKEP